MKCLSAHVGHPALNTHSPFITELPNQLHIKFGLQNNSKDHKADLVSVDIFVMKKKQLRKLDYIVPNSAMKMQQSLHALWRFEHVGIKNRNIQSGKEYAKLFFNIASKKLTFSLMHTMFWEILIKIEIKIVGKGHTHSRPIKLKEASVYNWEKEINIQKIAIMVHLNWAFFWPWQNRRERKNYKEIWTVRFFWLLFLEIITDAYFNSFD